MMTWVPKSHIFQGDFLTLLDARARKYKEFGQRRSGEVAVSLSESNAYKNAPVDNDCAVLYFLLCVLSSVQSIPISPKKSASSALEAFLLAQFTVKQIAS